MNGEREHGNATVSVFEARRYVHVRRFSRLLPELGHAQESRLLGSDRVWVCLETIKEIPHATERRVLRSVHAGQQYLHKNSTRDVHQRRPDLEELA